MAVKAVPLVPSDLELAFQIRDRALLPSQVPISTLLFLPPFTPAMKARETSIIQAKTNTIYFKAIDVGNGTMLACMRARFVPARVKAAEVQDAAVKGGKISVPPYREGCGMGEFAWGECWRILGEAKKECFDLTEAHVYLDLLATDPGHQRRGAGRCLLEKLTEIADEAGQKILLASTDMARPVYEKVGFEAMKEIVLDTGEVKSKERFTLMIRLAKKGRLD